MCRQIIQASITHNTINYLDLSTHRNTNNIDIGIYRKPAHTEVTIKFSSNHPLEPKFSAFSFYINRMLTLPITKQAKKQEWKIILTIAQNNGFPLQIIHNLKKKLMVKKQNTPTTITQNKNKKIGNILVSQSTNKKNNHSLQTH